MSENAPKVALTKDEKLTALRAQLAKLIQKIDDVENDRVPAPAAKKVVYMPFVGEKVLATVGRTTATSKPEVVEGTVLAIKLAAIGDDGKAKGATQVRVRIYEGQFEEQTVTLYPAQLVSNEPKPEAAAE